MSVVRSVGGLLVMLAAVVATAANAEEYQSGIVWKEPKVINPGPVGGPPSDAIVLFDGKDLSKWEGGDKWEIKDGIATSKKGGIRTKDSFGDCQLHIEWATPSVVKGNGQGRGNSGVYMMGFYEVQILDSFNNTTYFDGQAGALYKQKPPLVNACRKPGEWQSYDIIFDAPRFDAKGNLLKAAYITVLHNGVLIQHHTRLVGATEYNRPPYYMKHAEKLPITLQYHGNPIRFKNIWLREFKEIEGVKTQPKSSSVTKAEEGFKPIFDGQSLKGWDGDLSVWSVKDGAILGRNTKEKPIKKNTFLVWREGETDDFELKLEFRIIGGNSGIQYRSFEDPAKFGKGIVAGYQADIEDGERYMGCLYGEHFRDKVLAGRGQKTVVGDDHNPKVVGSTGDPKKLFAAVKKHDWNEYHIRAQGDRFTHQINGTVMCECEDADKSIRRRAGILALQVHSGPPMTVEFRNIRMKRLKLEDRKKVVFVAGKPSHGWGAHEHNAGCLLLADAINKNVPDALATVYKNGWPSDPTAFDNADAIVMYCDGGENHYVNKHLPEVDALMKRGIGLACLHYAVEVPKEKTGKYFLDWLGGYFEVFWSTNPHWTAEFKAFPDHPISRGVKPFTINDEWYYNMRFLSGTNDVTPILSAIPPEETRTKGFGSARGGNAHLVSRRGMPEVVAWARERPDSGRGFGFTGGHVHRNWGDDNFRKLVLNAVAWIAHIDPPAEGIVSKTPTDVELDANQDEPKPKASAAK